ncbi:hypothetical protein GCM10028791_03610 [Echinicola sediminis]
MGELPGYISIVFELVVFGTVAWLYAAVKSRLFLVMAVVWIVLQSLIAQSGFYQYTEAVPPRLMLFGVFPTLLLIAFVFGTAKGKALIDQIDLKTLTYFHFIRVPVEIILFLLFREGEIPVNMTFEGSNFDLFSGISAPIVAYLAFRGDQVNRRLLLGWNIVGLLLLFNVVITAILALPSPFQQLAFDQPNRAVMYFPFNLLPALVVPAVLFGHLVAFRRLGKMK